MRRKRKSVPIMLFWSKREQQRFIDAVERFVCAVGDMEVMVREIVQERECRKRKARKIPAEPSTTAAVLENAR